MTCFVRETGHDVGELQARADTRANGTDPLTTSLVRRPPL